MTTQELKKHLEAKLKPITKQYKAETLLIFEKFLNYTNKEIILRADANIPITIITRINKLIENRKNHIPLQYLLGYSWFYNNKFSVNRFVLIPRPETEILVELSLLAINKFHKKRLKILEIGCGSGCISISISVNYNKTLNIDSLDVSRQALKVARRNEATILRNNLIHWDKKDILTSKITKQYDLIISNPPYIKSTDLKNLDKEVLKEPLTALDGGKDGLKFYKRFLDIIERNLLPFGKALFEIEPKNKEKLAKLFADIPIKFHKDLNGDYRFIEINKGS